MSHLYTNNLCTGHSSHRLSAFLAAVVADGNFSPAVAGTAKKIKKAQFN